VGPAYDNKQFTSAMILIFGPPQYSTYLAGYTKVVEELSKKGGKKCRLHRKLPKVG
jgi:hypothetical protein